MPFQKGNKDAAKQRRLFGDALRRICTQSPERIKKLAEGLIEMAEQGEQWAFKELIDRLDGKAHQSMEVAYTEQPLEDMDDAELLEIATAGRPDRSGKARSKAKPPTIQ